MDWKQFERKRSWPIYGYYTGVYLNGPRSIKKNNCQNNRCPGQRSVRESPEYRQECYRLSHLSRFFSAHIFFSVTLCAGLNCWSLIVSDISKARKGTFIELPFTSLNGKNAKFARHRNDSNWETLTERRKIARICALFKAYTGERAWKAIGEQGRSW
jgi:hypothetical protein